jgi:proteasome accessory factor B
MAVASDTPPLQLLRMPSNDKLLRWFDLLAALLRRRAGSTFEELARDVPAYAHDGPPDDALQRKFERDKDELRAAGIPIETLASSEGDASRYRLRASDFYLPYLVLTGHEAPRVAASGYRELPSFAVPPDEAASLRRAAERVQSLGAPPLTADADRALRKLRYDLPLDLPVERAAPRIDALQFTQLVQAAERRKRVTFVYHSMERDTTATRTVEPYGLVFLTGHWYLVAHDPEAGAQRLFRTSRMQQVQVNTRALGTPDFVVPPGFDLKVHARVRPAWALGAGDTEIIEVEVARAVGDAVAAMRLGEPVGDDPAAPRRIRFTVRRRDAFLRWVLGFAGDLRVVAPAPAVTAWQALLHDTLAAQGEAAQADVASVAAAPVGAAPVGDSPVGAHASTPTTSPMGDA